MKPDTFWERFILVVVILGFIAYYALPSPSQSSAASATVPTIIETTGVPVTPTQADKDRCQIQAQEYAYQQAQAVITASDAQAKAMGGYTLSEGDPTKVGIYEPDLQNAYLNCIDNTNY